LLGCGGGVVRGVGMLGCDGRVVSGCGKLLWVTVGTLGSLTGLRWLLRVGLVLLCWWCSSLNRWRLFSLSNTGWGWLSRRELLLSLRRRALRWILLLGLWWLSLGRILLLCLRWRSLGRILRLGLWWLSLGRILLLGLRRLSLRRVLLLGLWWWSL
jgi:hypothetical protein